MSMRAVILMYHIVDRPASHAEARFACPPRLFNRHMEKLHRSGRRVMPLASLVEALEAGDAEADGAVVVTLDDGFADNLYHALPALEHHRIPATVFVVAGRVGGHNEWMTERGFPPRRMLDWDGVRTLSRRGVTIGCHTLTHPRLTGLDEHELRREIVDARTLLEERIDGPVEHFAYPYGDFSDREVELLQAAGFRSACTTRSGFNRAGEDPLRLRRIEVYGSDSPARLLRKIQFGSNDAGPGFLARYYLGRIRARLTRGSG